jgi:hypothetical protein
MRKALFGILATGIVAIGLPALAGYKTTKTVSIGSNWASGALGSARYSSDSKQQIGCRVDSFDPSHGLSMFCYATNSSGASKSCWSTDFTHIDLFKMVNGDSHLYFEVDSGGYCSRMRVTNASEFEPKVR